MKKTIYNKFDKKLIPALPRVLFEGRIITILTAGETEKAVDYLLSKPILGIDTETRPSFKRGITHKVSLLQVSTSDTCFLFRLNHTDLTPALIRLLEDKNVPKVGLSLNDDIHALQRRKPFEPGYFIDLQKHVNEIGIEDMSLQKLYANLIGKRISKSQQLSNWENDVLKENQKLYAATDAWACIVLYEEIVRLKITGDYALMKVIEQEKNNNQG
ncbi:MAG: 3'-5' exonuclease [Prevotella sp.]|uniref:3'-5' exonuclease n=1 Tax=Prevotella sp. TaxID=59823 RepID=UPI002A34A82D|nr:3'-5' exonuclease [Prevotella sp.]MDD7318189.1 3'-5' exonuclease domain-containing protein 2 [Prevotellaceae bacterium]MDY4020922.1 3'-5' exonuclease [Prevotella sp.]